MLDYLTRIWYGFISFLAILLPFGKDVSTIKIGSGLRWALHIFLMLLILVGLYFLNKLFFRSGVYVGWAQDYWLPMLFILVYFLTWTGWWTWKLLMAAPPPSSFPDIDAAWEEGMRALAQGGIRVTDMPMFLVLGRPEAPEDHFFNAAQLQLVVKQSPPGPMAPLHVYASRDAIFVTCAGASLLGKHASIVALEGIEQLGGTEGGGGGGESPEADKTIRPSKKEKKVIKQLALIAGRQMNVVERRAARRALGMPMPDITRMPAEVELWQARLAHLCRLMVRDREPFCAINGILILAPIGGTDTEHDAQQTADATARDLATLRRGLRMQCPVLVLACDLEALPGFADFIRRVSAKDRLGRLGQRFPLASPDLAGERLEAKIDNSIHHLCNSYLRDWVYRSFMADEKGFTDAEKQTTTTNIGLYLFLDEMRARRKHLSRIVTHGLAKEGPTPLLYAGCYLAATGADAAREQAFVPGVFKRLLENQNLVSWTNEALAEDRRCHGRAQWGYTLLAGLAAVLVAAVAAYYIFFRRPG